MYGGDGSRLVAVVVPEAHSGEGGAARPIGDAGDVTPDVARRWPVSARGLLAILLGLAWLHGSLYAGLMPPWGLIDEAQHLHYIQHLAEGRGQPVVGETYLSPEILASQFATKRWEVFHWTTPTTADPVELGLEAHSYEAYQPPLFYWLMTPLYWALPGDILPGKRGSFGQCARLESKAQRAIRLELRGEVVAQANASRVSPRGNPVSALGDGLAVRLITQADAGPGIGIIHLAAALGKRGGGLCAHQGDGQGVIHPRQDHLAGTEAEHMPGRAELRHSSQFWGCGRAGRLESARQGQQNQPG